MLLSIIVPTYNEAATIRNTIYQITKVLWRTNFTKDDYEILIIDDNSPDGTASVASETSARVIVRTQDPGLSQSVVEGFAQAKGEIIIVTDADLSHDISIIPEMYLSCKSNDIVIGSRYMEGGGIKDWPLKRRIISWGATFVSRILFPYVTDPVSGFFAVKRDLVQYAPLKPRGYKILLEILGRSYWHTIKEIPYTFTNRKVGESKLKTGTILEFIQEIIEISTHPTGRAQKELTKIKRFAVVGVSGIFVNMIMLATLKEWFSVPLVWASFMAIECAIITNFLVNDRWTFHGEGRDKPLLHRALSFNAVSIGGMIINVVILALLSALGVWYILGNLAGIIFGFGWNFLINRKITWSKK
jgi:dolichol-phosphate mannosyltransferase